MKTLLLILLLALLLGCQVPLKELETQMLMCRPVTTAGCEELTVEYEKRIAIVRRHEEHYQTCSHGYVWFKGDTGDWNCVSSRALRQALQW